MMASRLCEQRKERYRLLKPDVFSSDMHLRNVSGEQSIKTLSGDIDVRLAWTATSPEFDLETFSGDVKTGR